jgi:LEA14-like dessication related protein
MKNIRVVVVVLITLVLSACGRVKDFQFKNIVSWRINSLGFNASSVAAELLFYNPNTFTVTFKHLEGDVALEGKDFGHCTSDTTVRIEPKQNFILPVVIQLKPAATLSAGLQLISKDSVRVHFNGFARVGRSGIYINYKFDTETKIATSF